MIDKIISLFCKRALKKRRYSAKETFNLIDPTDRSHPIAARPAAGCTCRRILLASPISSGIPVCVRERERVTEKERGRKRDEERERKTKKRRETEGTTGWERECVRVEESACRRVKRREGTRER